MGGITWSKSRVIIWTILTLAVSLALSTIIVSQTHATTWSWSEQSPKVFESTVIPDSSLSTYCSQEYQLRLVVLSGWHRTCVSSGENIVFGTYFNYGGFSTAIGFGKDPRLYRFSSEVCYNYDGCLYLPETDTLVTKQYKINNLVRSLVIYKNFSKRLTRVTDNLPSLVEYYFDSSKPDYILQDKSQYPWPIGGVGASANGKWLAVELRQMGYGLLNVETLEMRRIVADSPRYGMGYDPSTELAVTNDGKTVAIMGSNTGLSVHTITASCGYNMTDQDMVGPAKIDWCPATVIDTGEFIDRFYAGLHPKFSDDDGELSFYAQSFVSEQRAVVLQAYGYSSPRMDYLALGDSFTSGEGETEDGHYLGGTNTKFEKCHVSDRSYPYLIAQDLNIDTRYMKSVACSGATTGDVVGDDNAYLGQGERLGNKNMNLSFDLKTASQITAKEKFIPGRVHQMAFVKRYHPKVITIGIGGNDAGFMDKLKACVGMDDCEWATTAAGREKTALEAQAIFGSLVNTYTKLHEVSPSSKIYVIGYPKVIDHVAKCSVLNGALLSATEREFMNEGIVYINQVVAMAAKKAGVAYVDIENSFGDQVLCGKVSPSVMNAIRIGDDSPINNQLNWFKLIGQESFHPKPTGHSLIFDTIKKSVPDIFTFNYCENSAFICPITSVAPSPSSYWLVNGETHDYAEQKVADFASHTMYDDTTSHKFEMPAYSFAPGSIVRAEIHSEPQLLGNFEATNVGASSFTVDLPSKLEFGYHTLHLLGTAYGGQAIDYYQTILYTPQEVEVAPPKSDNPIVAPDDPVSMIQDNPDSSQSVDVSVPVAFASQPQKLSQKPIDDSSQNNPNQSDDDDTIATGSFQVSDSNHLASARLSPTKQVATMHDKPVTKLWSDGFNFWPILFVVMAVGLGWISYLSFRRLR